MHLGKDIQSSTNRSLSAQDRDLGKETLRQDSLKDSLGQKDRYPRPGQAQ